ncbi:hypothetical protein EDC94DRAFT_627188 [Helicostylum pulchrum]|nr:hypothetical protein EDC94DRAFT_627188 [Helicostylum pulchrum]
MPENNLFQFAQVIAELPMQNTNYNSRYLHIRKNACVVCSICFTCSKYYGVDCACQEVQPRRGKNLPPGGLDSRAKKLHREDVDDFEFSIKWINENAHNMYKDDHNTVIGLRELIEVSLCKAHSSTLYRAKKRHERLNSESMCQSVLVSGGLAARVRDMSFNQPQVPDFTQITHSTSSKRKRVIKSPKIEARPSVSTPLYGSRNNQFMQQIQQQITDNFPSQLPPLQEHTSRKLIPHIPMVIETVSLKSTSSIYYFRNLAITDLFTFRDLLAEIDMTGSPPQGKRIVISDQEKFYPLDQPIRSVIKRPNLINNIFFDVFHLFLGC